MKEDNRCLEEFLRKNKFVLQRKKVTGIACGKAMRKGVCFETSISFNEKTKEYKVTGHGEGDYDTLEEVASAIAIPETRGLKKIDGGHVKFSISFSAEERNILQAAADRNGVSFNAFVRTATLNAIANSEYSAMLTLPEIK